MLLSNFQLIIFPENPTDVFDEDLLSQALKSIGLIGDAEGDSNVQRFQTGEQFLSHLCFLGCSPDIELHPQKNKAYTYIEIPKSTDQARFISGINIKVPRCPDCKKERTHLPERLKIEMELDDEIRCQHCQFPIERYKLNWRRTACFARSTIIIGNVYESEAVPDDQFLMALNEETGFSWEYAYIRLV